MMFPPSLIHWPELKLLMTTSTPSPPMTSSPLPQITQRPSLPKVTLQLGTRAGLRLKSPVFNFEHLSAGVRSQKPEGFMKRLPAHSGSRRSPRGEAGSTLGYESPPPPRLRVPPQGQPAQPQALDRVPFSAPGTHPTRRRSAPGRDPLPGRTPNTLGGGQDLRASCPAGNTLPRHRAPAPRPVPHRDERCLRVVVAAGRKAPGPPAAHSGLGPRAPVSDRDHQRLPTARTRRATQPAMSP